MENKTKEYSKFKFLAHNRPIDWSHVKKIARSIQSRNMLDQRPIEVNEKMEIIDGQHRLEAAKQVDVEIYYKIVKESKTEDIIQLNISKNWTQSDFLNYYVRNEYPEYKKLFDYMKKNEISLKLGLAMTSGQNHENSAEFKLGNYKFEGESNQEVLDMCQNTIDYIKKMNGFSNYTSSTRFWLALIKLINHTNFSMDKWLFNLARMVHKFGPRATNKDYQDMFMNCYNWKNGNKIDMDD